MPDYFNYGVDQLSIGKVMALAKGSMKGVLSTAAVNKVRTSQKYIQDVVGNSKMVYGVNTGFGILANTKISEEDTRTLQHKILQSHSVGVGDPIPAEIAKMMLITKLHSLAQGYSGIQLATLERIIFHIDHDI